MKNTFLLAAMAIVSLVAASCNKENVDPQADQVQTPITINASYQGNGAKVSYSEEGNTISATWQTGDVIDVVYNGNVNTLTLATGAGTRNATFTGTITGTPSATALLICYVRDQNAPAGSVTVNADGSYTYVAGNFLSQDGTLASAASRNLYYGTALYGDGSNISCTFGVNTSMMKFTVQSPTSAPAGTEGVTLTYKSGDAELAKATFTVGTGGANTVYLSIPAGQYSGEQTLVYNGGGYTKSRTLSSTAAHFAAGETYSLTLNYGPIDLANITEDHTFVDGDELTGTLASDVQLSIAAGATVTLAGVSINADNSWSSSGHAGLTCLGDATILLADGTDNTVHGMDRYYPGIYVPVGSTLTINGNGALTARGIHATGIGAQFNPNGNFAGWDAYSCGNITINGGTIVAETEYSNAAIGGSNYAYCGTVTIGTGITSLTATGGNTNYNVFPIGRGANASCTSVMFGSQEAYHNDGNSWSISTDEGTQTYGGLSVNIANIADTYSQTWTLTPAAK